VEEELYNNNNSYGIRVYLCDVCGYEWEIRIHDDFFKKNISLEDVYLQDEPRKCPSCGNSHISEL